MRFDQVFELTEARGSSSFDYKYWFWAKKEEGAYGLGYARQDVEVDIKRKGEQAADAAEEIEKILSSLENDEEVDNLEVIERKVKANTKRLKGIVDLFHSPIVIHWLNNDPPKVVELPKEVERDVTDSSGRRIDVVDLFTDKQTSEFVTHVMDWDKVTINDETDSLNTVTARFLRYLFGSSSKVSKKKIRALARGEGLDMAMKDLDFKSNGIEVISFEPSDYDFIPDDLIGSKKVVKELKEIIEVNFADILKTARKRFK